MTRFYVELSVTQLHRNGKILSGRKQSVLSIMPRNTDQAHNKHMWTPNVISIKYRLSLPDDGSYVTPKHVGVILICVF